MFGVPFDNVVADIVKETGLGREIVLEKINEKVKSLKGLVSEQGAACIVANELGVKIGAGPGAGRVEIEKLFAGMGRATVIGRVLRLYDTVTFKYKKREGEGKVKAFLLSDETGRVRVACWDENLIQQLENDVKEGDILKLTDSRVTKNKFGNEELHLNSDSKIFLNPDDPICVKIPPLEEMKTKIYDKTTIAELEQGQNHTVLATIVQLYERHPFYEVCPVCKKSLKQGECPEKHPFSNKDYALKLAFVIDDGTGSVLCLAFAKTAEILTGLSAQEAVTKAKDLGSPEELIPVFRKKLLGKVFLFGGTAKINTYNQQLEFLCNRATPADPVKETKEEIFI